jgi:TRAP-type C4-dicarboxylate transport system permease small subunit
MLKRLVAFLLTDLVDYTVALILAAISILVLSQVVFRYVLDHPLAWSEELTRYLIIWLTFLGSSLGIRKNGHIRVEILFRMIPPAWGKALNIFIELSILFFLAVLVWQGIHTTRVFMLFKSSALGLAQGYVFMAVPVGACIMICHMIVKIGSDLTSRGNR